MIIFLVQSGGSLDGADGYSYGLLHGGHNRLLCSFVDFMDAKRSTIFPKPPAAMDRRTLSRRALESMPPEEGP